MDKGFDVQIVKETNFCHDMPLDWFPSKTDERKIEATCRKCQRTYVRAKYDKIDLDAI